LGFQQLCLVEERKQRRAKSQLKKAMGFVEMKSLNCRRGGHAACKARKLADRKAQAFSKRKSYHPPVHKHTS
jgi:hypothetical protein